MWPENLGPVFPLNIEFPLSKEVPFMVPLGWLTQAKQVADLFLTRAFVHASPGEQLI